MERRLAAILAADVVGYSRLMGADEAGTMALLAALRRDRVEPLIAEHRGRVFKLMGDGILAEFPSVVDAVSCAVAWQEAVAGAGLQFRIGVNLGDVIVEAGDVYGNGVNIAARLEALADPGGVCLSGAVHAEIRRKLDLAFEDMGERRVKNIEEPVRAYRVVLGSRAPVAPVPRVAAAKPAVAVLPFNNMSGDPEQEFFADGTTEDIITALSRTRWFEVTARNSTFAYKGKSPDIREVAQTLGVGYVLEGSVRKGGNRARITVQLIDAATGNHIWAERYDRGLDDVFAVQDEIAQRISSALTERVWQDIARNLGAKDPAEYGAWDFAIRGVEFLHRVEPDAVDEAEKLFNRAHELDPDNHVAHIGLGFCHVIWASWADPDGSRLERAHGHGLRLLEIAPDDAQTYRLLSRVHQTMGRPEEAWACVERALRINPNDGDIIGNRAVYHLFDGDFPQAIEWLDMVLELHGDTPHTMDIMRYWKALALFGAKDYRASMTLLSQLTGVKFLKTKLQVLCQAMMGDVAGARAATGELLKAHPEMRISDTGLWKAFRQEADRAHFRTAMREAGYPQ